MWITAFHVLSQKELLYLLKMSRPEMKTSALTTLKLLMTKVYKKIQIYLKFLQEFWYELN